MKKMARCVISVFFVGVILVSGSIAFADSGGDGGDVISSGSFNNGGAKAGDGGNGNNGSGGDGGDVISSGSFNNGGAKAGDGGDGGSVKSTSIKLQSTDRKEYGLRYNARLNNLSR
jgi:hypothetical protein